MPFSPGRRITTRPAAAGQPSLLLRPRLLLSLLLLRRRRRRRRRCRSLHRLRPRRVREPVSCSRRGVCVVSSSDQDLPTVRHSCCMYVRAGVAAWPPYFPRDFRPPARRPLCQLGKPAHVKRSWRHAAWMARTHARTASSHAHIIPIGGWLLRDRAVARTRVQHP